jgi:DNA-binding transcriptional ArsR family regulator
LPDRNPEIFAPASQKARGKMSKAEELARVFKVLSVESRVKIVQLLKSRVLCVNALAKQLAISPAAVSQHLRILRDAGIVTAEKRGYFVHYRLNEETLAGWRNLAGRFLAEIDPSVPFIEIKTIEEKCHD